MRKNLTGKERWPCKDDDPETWPGIDDLVNWRVKGIKNQFGRALSSHDAYPPIDSNIPGTSSNTETNDTGDNGGINVLSKTIEDATKVTAGTLHHLADAWELSGHANESHITFQFQMEAEPVTAMLDH
jgi:hypothetical protein